MSESIYASWKPVLEKIMHRLVDYLENKSAEQKASSGESAFEHINYRIKGEESMISADVSSFRKYRSPHSAQFTTP